MRALPELESESCSSAGCVRIDWGTLKTPKSQDLLIQTEEILTCSWHLIESYGPRILEITCSWTFSSAHENILNCLWP